MSSLQRLYVEQALHIENKLCLENNSAHYVINVLRAKIGSKFIFFDSINGEFLGEVVSIKKKQVEVLIPKKLRNYKKLRKLKLVFSLIKQDRMNMLLEKTTELGVTDFQPILTERSQVKKINIDRMKRIVIEASEQSNRLTVPMISDLITLQEYLNKNQDNAVFCCERLENAEHISLKNYDTVIIGPEGGFSENEKTYLAKAIKTISLSSNILRAETAAIVAIDRVRSA